MTDTTGFSEDKYTLTQEEINEQEAARQEQYYWYVIAEFYGACKHFGMEKVMLDLKTFRESVEKPKEEPRIQLLT